MFKGFSGSYFQFAKQQTQRTKCTPYSCDPQVILKPTESWIFSPEATSNTVDLLQESQFKVTLIAHVSSFTFNQVTKSSQYFFINKPILSIFPLSCSWARPSPPTTGSLMLQDQQVSEITVSFFSLLRRRQWHPTPVLLPGKFHGWRSLVGCNPWGR